MNEKNFASIRSVLKGSKLAQVVTYEGLASTFEMNSAASESDMEMVRKYFNYALPPDYMSFLQVFDGATFFKVQDIGGFSFLSCRELIAVNDFQKKNLGDEWRNDILFCECLGDGDYIGFRILDNNSYLILDCFSEEVPDEWSDIHQSFDSFLQLLIESKGEKFWLR